MSLKLDGKKLALQIEHKLNLEIEKDLNFSNRKPGLAVIRIGDDQASAVYVSNKEKACNRVGINSFVYHLDSSVSFEEVEKLINKLNISNEIDGILLQLPIPNHLSSNKLISKIDPSKDADGLHEVNLGKLIKGEEAPRSCTPAGIINLLKENNIQIAGKRSVVIGRSILVGQPLALMLLKENSTVTIAHSKTINLKEMTKEADILVAAIGKPNFITRDYIKPNAILVDVGIHRLSLNNKKENILCGDILIDDVISLVDAYTPVPGGVGPMTVTMLLVNTVRRWQKSFSLKSTISNLIQ
tara:strand:+ start:9125 stop:10021 length:897 start_codon:yes stop_codon:yes gene_type:complete